MENIKSNSDSLVKAAVPAPSDPLAKAAVPAPGDPLAKAAILVPGDSLVSVVIPVYNAKRYLAACMDSVLGQTYRHLEVILVDDGSTDGSGALCEQYGRADSRVRVFHQKNRGVSAARNRGLWECHGDYVAFVDADDLLFGECIDRLLVASLQYDADIALCDYCCRIGNQTASQPLPIRDVAVVTGRDEAFSRYFETMAALSHLYSSVWAKLFRRQVILGLLFDTNLRIAEDAAFLFQCYSLDLRLVEIPYTGYQYVQSEKSATRGQVAHGSFEGIPARRYLLRETNKCAEPLQKKAVNEYGLAIYTALSKMIQSGKYAFYKERTPRLKKYCRDIAKDPRLGLKFRWMLRFFCKAPALYWRTLRILIPLIGRKSRFRGLHSRREASPRAGRAKG